MTDRKEAPVRYTRVIGTIYAASAIVGLVFGFMGLVALWVTRPAVVREITTSVALVGRTLTATADTIAVVESSIQEAGADLDIMQEMVVDMSGSLESSRGMIDRTGNLVGGQLVDFVDNTRASLDSVQTSADVVDNVLRTITGIPIIGPWLGGQRYNPPIPLGESVANVKKSMDPLPDTLFGIQKDLKTTSDNVATMKSQIDTLSGQIDAIRVSIASADKVVNEYRDVTNKLQTRYQQLEKRVPLMINTSYIILTLLLLWLLLQQAGLLLQGLMLLGVRLPRGEIEEIK